MALFQKEPAKLIFQGSQFNPLMPSVAQEQQKLKHVFSRALCGFFFSTFNTISRQIKIDRTSKTKEERAARTSVRFKKKKSLSVNLHQARVAQWASDR